MSRTVITSMAWTLALAASLSRARPASASPDPGPAQQLVLGISEGTSGGLDHAQVITKYQGLAEVIGKALKAKVSVVFAREFKQLEEGMQTGRFDLVMARPSDYPARGMRDYGYSYIASTKPDGQCFVIVPKGSALKTINDVKGQRIALPEQIAYMSRFCAAELRDKGILVGKENVQFVREQAAVGFYLDNKFADVGGVASYSGIAKKWEKTAAASCTRACRSPTFRWWPTSASSPSRSRPSRTSCWPCPPAMPARMCSSASASSSSTPRRSRACASCSSGSTSDRVPDSGRTAARHARRSGIPAAVFPAAPLEPRPPRPPFLSRCTSPARVSVGVRPRPWSLLGFSLEKSRPVSL
jgi:phosphonate transport system substrate-binding protein